MVIALLAAAAFCAGFVDAIAGGGGLLTVPALLMTGLPPQVVLATNKGQAVFGAISSAASFWKRGGIDRARAPLGFFCGAVGSLAGARLLLAMRPEPLKPIVLGLLVFAAIVVALRERLPLRPGGVQRHRLALAAAALLLGAYDGFFGPGTGTLLIVAFVVLMGDSLTRASGNAKVVNLASNLAALAMFAAKGAIVWKIALPMAACNASGAYLGAKVALARGDRFVRLVVLAVVAALVVKLGADLFRASG